MGRYLVGLACLALVAAPAQALAIGLPSAASLSIDQAVAIALSQQPRLGEAAELEQAIAARKDQDVALGRPQLSLVSVGQGGSPGSAFSLGSSDGIGLPSGVVGSRETSLGAGLSLGDSLWSPHLSAIVERDDREVHVLKAGYLDTAARTIERTKEAFLDALRTRRQVMVADQLVQDRELTVQQAQALASAGLVSLLDVDQAQVQLQDAQAQELEARNDARTAYDALLVAMGKEPGSTTYDLLDLFTASASIQVPVANADLSHDPALDLERARTRAARSQIDVAKSASAPDLNVLVSAGWSNLSLGAAPQPTGVPLYAGGIGVSMPLFTSGYTSAELARARARDSAEEQALVAVDQQIRQRYAAAASMLAKDQAELQVLDDEVKVARRAVTLAQQRYKFQLASILDVVNAQTAEADVEVRWVDAGYAVQRDLAQLAYLDGTDLRKFHAAAVVRLAAM